MNQAVIVAMGRSAIGRAPRGTLQYTRPEELGAQVITGVLNKIPDFDVHEIEDVIVGCAFPEAQQGINLGRILALKAGLSEQVPGQTVNRFCSSGLQAIATASYHIMSGQVDCILAGGVESMSTVPMGGNFPAPDPGLTVTLPETYMSMGITAEIVAKRYGISRADMDQFAVMSHQRAAAAISKGLFAEDIIPVQAARPGLDEMGRPGITFQPYSVDEGVRTNTSLEALAKLKSPFQMGGSVTAGNSSQTSDGAAFVLMMSAEKAHNLGLKPLAVFRSFAVGGVAPDVMGLGPIVAIPKALKLAGITKEDLGLIELNEAFASQSLACVRELELNPELVNVNGGAIALGHPLGCTGAFLTTKLVSEIKRRNASPFGVVSMCIGGGMGAAGVYEIIA
ncbi:MAG: acetyl-CoA C-acyltransferase [Firmicutes bacterium HGW-Firmicutes-4]|nr:MAG: acetyl-CoA C-acyltransferase [Firmicutes bacterium HGW-Firmicutes-4]